MGGIDFILKAKKLTIYLDYGIKKAYERSLFNKICSQRP